MTISSESAEPAPKKRSSRVYMIVAVIIAAVLLVWSLQDVDWGNFVNVLKTTQYDIMALAFITFSVSFFFRALRWQVLLSAEKKLSVPTVFWGTMIGYLGNNVLPARAGEVIRSALIGRKTRISISYVLATALTERIIDVPALVLASLLAINALPNVPDWVTKGTQTFAVLGIIGIAGIFILPYLEKWIKAVIEPILARLPIPGHVGESLIKLLEEFLYGMKALHSPIRAVLFAVLTVIIWLTEAYLAIQVASAMHIVLTLPQSLLLLAGLGFGSAVPSTPGYVGIYQAVCVRLLTLPLFGGYKNEMALAFSILFQGLTLVVVLFWGVLGFWRMSAMPEPAAIPDAQVEQAPV
jgi:uncharacterized protein (TIRG00374 family)